MVQKHYQKDRKNKETFIQRHGVDQKYSEAKPGFLAWDRAMEEILDISETLS